MPVPKIDSKRCAARNRIAARRDGINAIPFRFLGAGRADRQMGGFAPLMTDDEALARINADLPADKQLSPDDVFIHYVEAANSSFISDRYCFLDTSTLKNIATDAEAGFAFMNSHRTGGLSTPCELPYGRTFAGRYEASGDDERAVVGFYMLARQMGPDGQYSAVYPNGANGPSTSDLNAGILAGTIFDVSVGLHGGDAICDVCGNDVTDYDACDHYPGTTLHMSEDEEEAQIARGVPDGAASYSLFDSHCGEVSAVYDGAVSGAGFRKVLTAAKQGKLDLKATAQARCAYSALLSKGDLDQMDENKILQTIENGFARLGIRLGGREPDTLPAADPAAPAATTPAVEELRRQLADTQAKLAAQQAVTENLTAQSVADRRAVQVDKNLARVEAAVKSFKIMPAARAKFDSLAKGEFEDMRVDHAAAQAAFELAMSGIEENGAVVALSGGGRLEVDRGDKPAPTSQEGQTLEQMAKERQEKTGRSYIDCFSQICSEHPDLARAHREVASEGR